MHSENQQRKTVFGNTTACDGTISSKHVMTFKEKG